MATECPLSLGDACQFPRCTQGNQGALDGRCLSVHGAWAGSITMNMVGPDRAMDLRHPDPARIEIVDIAIALGNQCRFAGHVRDFYSVAQHSILVSYLVPHAHALAGLLHDGSEAYLQDVTRMLKHSPEMAGYRSLEAPMQAAVFRRFGLDAAMPHAVHMADRAMTEWEYHRLLRGVHPAPVVFPNGIRLTEIQHLSPHEAHDAFLDRFHQLSEVPIQWAV